MNGYVGRAKLLLVAGLVLLAAACGDDGEGGRAAGPPAFVAAAPLRAVARPGNAGILTDANGREVLLRGVNVNSLGEYWQFDPTLPTVFPFEEADMDFLASLGLNFVRLVISWSRVEPQPGAYDEAYLTTVAEKIDALWQRGIYTLVDLHQDAWGPTLAARPGEDCREGEIPASGWDGAPGWATLTDDATRRCIAPLAGNYLRELSPAVLEAWAKFFDNRPGPGGVGIQDRYTAMLEHLAFRLGGRPGVMGYDIMNEPNAYPPDLVALAASLLPGYLPQEYIDILARSLESLADFYTRSVAALRRGEQRSGIEPRIILFEPSAVWPNVPAGSTVRPFTNDTQIAYGPHIYQDGISFLVPLDEAQVERVRAEAASYGGVPVLSGEWGASPATAGESGGYFERMIALQDREHWSVAHWLYQASCGDPHHHRAAVDGNLAQLDVWGYRDVVCTGPDTNRRGAVRENLRNRIGRPALQYAPGPIGSIAWNPATRVFTASGSGATAGNEMVLFVPGHHGPLAVVATGVRGLAAVERHGGLLYTAQAHGGEWSVRAAP